MAFEVPVLHSYMRWLHLRWPAGGVEALPEVQEDGQTAVAGLYIAGDLAGVPLLKLSADGGARAVRHMVDHSGLKPGAGGAGVVDLAIIGAGVAGMAAALEADAAGLSYLVIEAQQPFATLVNFPQRKPIYTYPIQMTPAGQLQFHADVRESLLEEVRAQTEAIPVRAGKASHISSEGSDLRVHLEGDDDVRAQRVLVAIGRSGNFRRLGVPGEALDHVSNRLHDPAEYAGRSALVVGGGDSAVEAALALSQAGAKVTLSYRKAALSRPKPENQAQLEAAVASGGIALALGSQVQRIDAGETRLTTAEGQLTVKAEAVFVLIGRDAPLGFFRKSRVPIRGELTRKSIAACLAFTLFCFALYNWKSGGSLAELTASEGVFPHSLVAQVNDVEPIPEELGGDGEALGVRRAWAWLKPIPPRFRAMADDAQRRLDVHDYTDTWDERGHLQRQVAAGLTHGPPPEGASARTPATSAVPGRPQDRTSLLGTLAVSAAGPSFWYTLAYVSLVFAFGLRRIRKRKTAYITVQTVSLMLIQAIPLFLLPEILLPLMGYHGLLPAGLADALFPAVDYGHGREYWRAYGLILAWPLNIYNWQTDEPLWAWLAIGGVQTFVIIPLIVWRWGKGAYCGWICSCGALAETLGDDHRQKMPHGPGWNRLNGLGQIILGVAALMMVLRICSWVAPDAWALKRLLWVAKDGSSAPEGWGWLFSWLNYKWTVDVALAGILGYGLYFWMSGRTWCRFACPLAALMHIYARFSRFRIFADKKKCISCNVCTSVCHQGIDVMAFANKGQAMRDPECVRCSACVGACPTGTLAFGVADSTGRPKSLDSLIASQVHKREGAPSLQRMGDDQGRVGS